MTAWSNCASIFLRIIVLNIICLNNILFPIVKVIREATHISGFLYEQPLSEVTALTHCGEALCARGHSLRLHSHPGFEFHYLARGGPFTWKVGKEMIRHPIGGISVTYPHEPHASGPEAYPETHFLWLGLMLDQFGEAGKRLVRLLTTRHCRLILGCGEAESLLRGLITQVISQRPYRATVVRAYLQTFIALLEQRLCAAAQNSEDYVPLLPYSHSTTKAISYLEKNLERRIPLQELAAAAACRGTTNFCTRFRKEVGIAPAAYHRALRLRAAREALRQPAFSVTMAALQFGFNSSQHFSTRYRREFGVSPSVVISDRSAERFHTSCGIAGKSREGHGVPHGRRPP